MRAPRRIARRELHGTAGVVRHALQQLAPVPLRQFLELGAGLARCGNVVHGQEDLDRRREQGSTPEGPTRLAEHTVDRGGGRVTASLGEAQEGEAGLRLAPASARVAVRPLGRRQLAPKAMELCLAVGGLGGRALVEAGRQPRPARGLDERVVPVTGELQDLRPVHEAAARERHEIRLAVAPPAQSGGPFLRAAHLVDLLTGEDHAAVDEPGDDRRELVRRERDHRLVEQRHPSVTRPPVARMCPCECAARANRSGSPKRWPIAAASPAAAAAASQLPTARCWKTAGRSA